MPTSRALRPQGRRISGEPQSRKDAAYRYIQSKILAGQLPTGETISELSLAKDIGISRTPIREAIGQLIAEGFLEQIPGRGTQVKRLTRSDIVELFELREALEVYAVGKLARESISPQDFEKLQGLCDEVLNLARALRKTGEQRLNAAQMERFITADLQFHLMLIRCACNRRILKVVRDTRLLIRIFAMRREGHSVQELERIDTFHRGVLAAVRAGDSAKAASLLGEHIRVSKQERLESFDRWERFSQMSEPLV